MRAPFTRVTGTAALTTRPGMNRFVWDFGGAGGARGGPLVPPGRYEIVLRVGDRSLRQEVELLMDPRVAADGVTVMDLQEQYILSLTIQQTMQEAMETDRRVQQALDRAQGESREALQALALLGAVRRGAAAQCARLSDGRPDRGSKPGSRSACGA